jgi:YD repeat-containing protein
MEDGMDKTTRTYDALGRLTEVDNPNAKVVTYAYLARVHLWAEVRSRKMTMILLPQGIGKGPPAVWCVSAVGVGLPRVYLGGVAGFFVFKVWAGFPSCPSSD